MSDIIDKVQKLLAQAEHPNTNAEEAETFFAKAQELMTKHAIDEAQVRLAGGAHEREKIVCETFVFSASDQNLPSKRSLLGVVALNNGCRVILCGAPWNRKNYEARIVGTPSDIAFSQMLYASAMMQSGIAARRAGIKGTAQRTGFMVGFAAGVAKRLEAANHKVEANTPGAALVLFDRKKEVDDEFGRMFPKTTQVATRVNDWSGYRSGVSAGRNADLSGGRTQVSRQRKAVGR